MWGNIFFLWNPWKFSYFYLLLVSIFELAVSRRAIRSLVTCYQVLFESWLVSRKKRNIATDYCILFSNFHMSAKFHTQRRHCYVLASQQEQILLLNITNCSWSWSLHAMLHRRVWVVRFSQPATRNVQNGIRAVQKCQGKKICNITRELLSNGVLPHLQGAPYHWWFKRNHPGEYN